MNLRSLLLLALISSNALAASDQDAVKTARLRQNEAIVKHQTDLIASFWTDDVTICRGLGIQMAGKAAYRKLFADDLGSPDEIIYQRLPQSIDVSAQWPLAFETGTWEGHLGKADGPVVIRGRYSAQWVKRDGRWQETLSYQTGIKTPSK